MIEPLSTYGVLSAHSDHGENSVKHQLLIQDLDAMGYHWRSFCGSWEGAPEKSVFVLGINLEDLIALGMKYEQEAVVHKDRGQHARLIRL